MPPRHVQIVKSLVEGTRRWAPWVFVCIAPIKPLFSGMYYGWINRHERVPVDPRPAPGESGGARETIAAGPSRDTGLNGAARDGDATTVQSEGTPTSHHMAGATGGGVAALSWNDEEVEPRLESETALGHPVGLGAAVSCTTSVDFSTCDPAMDAQKVAAPEPAANAHSALAPQAPPSSVSTESDRSASAPSSTPPEANQTQAATTHTVAGVDVPLESPQPDVAANGPCHDPAHDPSGQEDASNQAPAKVEPCAPQRPATAAPRARTGGHQAPSRSSNGAVESSGIAVAAPVVPRARPVRPAPSPERLLDEQLEQARRQSERRTKWAGRAERVTMVIGTLGPGGAERQLVTLAGELRRRGRGVCRAITIREPVGNDGHHFESLAATARLDRTTPMELGPALEWMDREGLGFVRKVLAPELFWDIPPLMRAFRATQPSVVHAWLDWSSLVAGFAAALLPVRRIVLSTRNVAPRNFPSLDQPYFRDMYRVLLRDPRVRLINNSCAGADDYAAWLGIRRSQIRVVRNGVDVAAIRHPGPQAVQALRAELDIPGHARLVAGVFRLAEEKQPHTFVDVAERILSAEPSAIVVHAGSGELEEQMRERVAQSPHASRFRLLGRRYDVPTLLSSADVCLLTSRKEGTPNVLIEAQILGCPVVATRAGGAPETFEHERTGFLCEVGDADALAGATLRLLRDEPLRRSMAESAQAFAAGRFALRRMADETIELYD